MPTPAWHPPPREPRQLDQASLSAASTMTVDRWLLGSEPLPQRVNTAAIRSCRPTQPRAVRRRWLVCPGRSASRSVRDELRSPACESGGLANRELDANDDGVACEARRGALLGSPRNFADPVGPRRSRGASGRGAARHEGAGPKRVQGASGAAPRGRPSSMVTTYAEVQDRPPAPLRDKTQQRRSHRRPGAAHLRVSPRVCLTPRSESWLRRRRVRSRDEPRVSSEAVGRSYRTPPRPRHPRR